jgi:hypothetical protein
VTKDVPIYFKMSWIIPPIMHFLDECFGSVSFNRESADFNYIFGSKKDGRNFNYI